MYKLGVVVVVGGSGGDGGDCVYSFLSQTNRFIAIAVVATTLFYQSCQPAHMQQQQQHQQFSQLLCVDGKNGKELYTYIHSLVVDVCVSLLFCTMPRKIVHI
jgi:hypothetical protein